MIPLIPIIAQLLPTLFQGLDKLFTSDDERAKAQAEIQRIQNEITAKVIEYESAQLSAQKDIIIAEAKGESWLQRNWRPILMLTIVAIIANNYILYPYISLFMPGRAVMLELPDGLWTLMQVGVGGYIGGRTLEKLTPEIKLNFGRGTAPPTSP